MTLFEPAKIGSLTLANRLLRSATFEGLADPAGVPLPSYAAFYGKLARKGLGGIITGFTCVSPAGRAMQPGQASITTDSHIPAFRAATDAVHRNGGKIILQLAHTGLQTVPAATGGTVYAPSRKRAWPPNLTRYFNAPAEALTPTQIDTVINDFAEAARRAREAGFDAVQLHAAHGYLIHQFLDPEINRRTDCFGGNGASGLGFGFLQRTIQSIRATVGTDYPLLIKVSAGKNTPRPADGNLLAPRSAESAQFEQLIRFLDEQRVNAIEVSYGTMANAFAIFRGQSVPTQAVLDFNPRYRTTNQAWRLLFQHVALPLLKRRFPPYEPMYNLAHAVAAKPLTRVPIICVGGFRSGQQISHAIEQAGIDFVSLCRPIICEPDFALKLKTDARYESRCANCNECAVMCDSGRPTRCYGRMRQNPITKFQSGESYEN